MHINAALSPAPLDTLRCCSQASVLGCCTLHTHKPAAALLDDAVSPTPAAETRIRPVVVAKEDRLSESIKESSLLLYQLSSAPRMSLLNPRLMRSYLRDQLLIPRVLRSHLTSAPVVAPFSPVVAPFSALSPASSAPVVAPFSALSPHPAPVVAPFSLRLSLRSHLHTRRQLLRHSLRSHLILGASCCAFLCALTCALGILC